jgi:signal transduction histidine kinase
MENLTMNTKSLGHVSLISWVIALLFAMVGPLFAAEQGTPAEAEAMAKKAVALIKSVGPEKAAEEFTNGKAFKDRDLYVAYTELTGKVLAHGGNPKLVGKNLMGLNDSDGNPFFQMLVDLAKNKGQGWSDKYRFMNPTTQKIEAKTMYVERVGEAYVGVGVYKN